MVTDLIDFKLEDLSSGGMKCAVNCEMENLPYQATEDLDDYAWKCLDDMANKLLGSWKNEYLGEEIQDLDAYKHEGDGSGTELFGVC
jgi:hypothetical protein